MNLANAGSLVVAIFGKFDIDEPVTIAFLPIAFRFLTLIPPHVNSKNSA